MTKTHTQLFVVLRYDAYQPESVAIENRISATRIVGSQAAADREVERLNALNGPKGCRYFGHVARVDSSLDRTYVNPTDPKD
jgi:hypothetical protein